MRNDASDRWVHARRVFACWLTIALAAAALAQTASRPDLHPFTFALSVSYFIVLLFAMLTRQPLLALNPERLRFARWEREGKVYDRKDVRAFQWALVHTPLGWLNPNVRMASGRGDIDRVLREMIYAEGTHLIAFVVSGASAAVLAANVHVLAGLWLALINIPMNLYPVMLQRWNRGRLLLVSHRLQARVRRLRTEESIRS